MSAACKITARGYGITARADTTAKAAGAKCLALLTTFPKEKLAGADFSVENLAAVPKEAVGW